MNGLIQHWNDRIFKFFFLEDVGKMSLHVVSKQANNLFFYFNFYLGILLKLYKSEIHLIHRDKIWLAYELCVGFESEIRYKTCAKEIVIKVSFREII